MSSVEAFTSSGISSPSPFTVPNHHVLSLTSFSMVLETGIFASQAIWLWRVRHVRAEAKKAGKTYDEYIAENPSKKLLASESSETFVDVEAGNEKRSASVSTEKPATSQHEHILATPDDAPTTSTEPLAEALQTPPAAVLKPSGSGALQS
jgi:hypothetical protein